LSIYRNTIPFIGRAYELDYLIRQSTVLGIPSRELLFICGPPGIGKTRLSMETISRLKDKDILAIYISVGSYDNYLDSLNNIIKQIDSFIERYSIQDRVINAVKKVFSDVKISISPLNPFTQAFSIELSRTGRHGVLDLFYRVFEKLSSLFYNMGGGVIFIDELQNILKLASGWSPYGLFKFFSSIQEYLSNGFVKFVLVTSDYLFRKEIVANVPGEHITTFYLGELGFNDTLDFIRCYSEHLVRDQRLLKDILDNIDHIAGFIGGFPDKIISFIRKVVLYNSVSKAIDSLVKMVSEDVIAKALSVEQTHNLDLKVLFTSMTDKPLSIRDLYRGLDRSYQRAIDDLVKYNILQYANSSYLGIYRWNSASGGEGGLDVVAPSSRLHLYGICSITGSGSSVCGLLNEYYKALI